MDCTGFTTHWSGHVAEALPVAVEADMLEHSRSCVPCGRRWRQQQDLQAALASVIEAHRPPDICERIVERHKLPELHRSRTTPTTRPATGTTVRGWWWPVLAAQVLGLIMGFGLARYSGFAQQGWMQMEMLRGGSPGGLGWTLLAGNEVLWTVLGVLLLLWLTRSKVWETLFPVKMPNSIVVARWMAVGAVVLGAMRVLCALMLALTAWFNAIAATGRQDLALWVLLLQVLSPLWSLAFWTALMVLLFGVANELAPRYLKPLQ